MQGGGGAKLKQTAFICFDPRISESLIFVLHKKGIVLNEKNVPLYRINFKFCLKTNIRNHK